MKTLSYLGPDGSHSYLLAKHIADLTSADGNGAVLMTPCDSFALVAQNVRAGGYGVLPLLNRLSGPVNESLQHAATCGDAFLIRLPIVHAVGKASDAPLVHEYYSHLRGIQQCSDYLSAVPRERVHAVSSTSLAAKTVAESRHGLAIVSRDAIARYGLEEVAYDVGNIVQGKQNETLFGVYGGYPMRERVSLDESYLRDALERAPLVPKS